MSGTFQITNKCLTNEWMCYIGVYSLNFQHVPYVRRQWVPSPGHKHRLAVLLSGFPCLLSCPYSPLLSFPLLSSLGPSQLHPASINLPSIPLVSFWLSHSKANLALSLVTPKYCCREKKLRQKLLKISQWTLYSFFPFKFPLLERGTLFCCHLSWGKAIIKMMDKVSGAVWLYYWKGSIW